MEKYFEKTEQGKQIEYKNEQNRLRQYSRWNDNEQWNGINNVKSSFTDYFNIFIYFMQLWDKCGTSSSEALGNLHLWVHRFSLRDLCNHIAGSATKSSLPKCCGDIIPEITAAL